MEREGAHKEGDFPQLNIFMRKTPVSFHLCTSPSEKKVQERKKDPNHNAYKYLWCRPKGFLRKGKKKNQNCQEQYINIGKYLYKIQFKAEDQWNLERISPAWFLFNRNVNIILLLRSPFNHQNSK